MRLSTKFILVSLVGGLSSVAIVGAVAYTKAKRSIEAAVGQACQIDAYKTAENANRVTHNAHTAIQRLAETRVMQYVITGDSDGDLQTFLMNFARVNKSFARVVAFNRNGEVIASSDLDDPGMQVSDRRFFERALAGRTEMSDVHRDEPSRQWVATMACPIPAIYDSHQIIGVLCAQWLVEELSDTLDAEEQETAKMQKLQTMILRRDGLLIAGSHVPQTWLFSRNLQADNLPSVSAALAGEAGYVTEAAINGRQALVGYCLSEPQEDVSGPQWIVLVVNDAAPLFQPIRSLWWAVMIVAAAVTVGVFVLSALVSFRLSAPIGKMAAAAEEVAHGNFDVRVQRQTSDEIGALADTFNQMVNELEGQRAQLVAMNEILKESNERLMAAQSSLMQADKMETVGRLAAGVAHEVKNPLAVISMGLDYLASDLPKDHDSNLPIVLNEMRDSTERADTIIRGLLDFSASSRWDVKDEDLNATIERSLQLVRHELVKNHITVDKNLGNDLPALKLNRTKIEQVFINLFINAAHAMPKGGTLSVRTSIHGHNGTAAVVAEVADTGTGIPADVLPRIFEPFFTTKPVGIGTGLGMCVVKNIIELHDGTITMSNRPEGGVQATITFKVERTVAV